MRTILVGYDGTGPAEPALRRAAELAQAFESKVVVVSVSPPEPVVASGGAFTLMPYYYPAADAAARTDEALWQQHREEVSSMTDLLAVVERGKDNLLHVEEYLARASGGENAPEANAPPAAGAAL